MKVYIWYPDGHGDHTLGVMAETEEDARKYIDTFIKENRESQWPWVEAGRWGTMYYQLSTYELGEAFAHEND